MPHLKNRQWIASSLVREIFGPGGLYEGWCADHYSPEVPIDVDADSLDFDTWDSYNTRHVVKGSQQEILKDEAPSKHYGVGILFPAGDAAGECPAEIDAVAEGIAGIEQVADEGEQTVLSKNERTNRSRFERVGDRLLANDDDDDTHDPDSQMGLEGLRLARLRNPSSMGITFVVDSDITTQLRVTVQGARYRSVVRARIAHQDGQGNPITPVKYGRPRTWWVRCPVELTFDVNVGALQNQKSIVQTEGIGPNLKLRLVSFSRDIPVEALGNLPASARLATVTLINESDVSEPIDDACLFQSRFSVQLAEDGKQECAFLPLPAPKRAGDEEEASVELLYRNVYTFASGHGCSGAWESDEGAPRARKALAEPIPFKETPPVTPNLMVGNETFEISMLPIAQDHDGWIAPLIRLGDLYETWINQKESESEHPDFPETHRKAAGRHVTQARECLNRIRQGIALLQNDSSVRLAFVWANEAVLLQQIAGRASLRTISSTNEGQTVWNRVISQPSLRNPAAANCKWRPFQIAFLLMSLKGLWEGGSMDRGIADLIWFPTGGGKTEAYLGATAFSLFARRIKNKDDSGTGVIMRYTLRLLTAQQFQRAAGLICAMEMIRQREEERLGGNQYSIGIWVGGGTTPNTHRDSVDAYNKTIDEGPDKYKHVLLRCPWCASSMGARKVAAHRWTVDGFQPRGAGANRYIFAYCPDQNCRFNLSLPVKVVDKDIYDSAPSLVIGTVDKFAQLAWKPHARAIFGIGIDGCRIVSPPELIIQDELHLITGPLGSMVGLYEGVVEELCTDYRQNPPTVPKLIASTATTRASPRQISDLYARKQTSVFPPPGLDAGDSFFATYDRDEDGRIKPGRMYLGVLARSFGSGLTVNVRVFSALLQSANQLPSQILNNVDAARNPWWTLLVFYNSLRELGSGLTLFCADIPERLGFLKKRWSDPKSPRRYLDRVIELTGRISNSEVPEALQNLEVNKGGDRDPRAVDACLASNIIEVGVDVPRLGLMAVVGQPKNTAQYIQATGRVGRQQDLPGLVVMVYDSKKSRDLSHFEQFYQYHGRLYASVEPATVTPFTVPVMERALHGAFIAWIRQLSAIENPDTPRNFVPPAGSVRNQFQRFRTIMSQRIHRLLDGNPSQAQALATFEQILAEKEAGWCKSNPVKWNHTNPSDYVNLTIGDVPLMRSYGRPCRANWMNSVWATPESLRGVDAEVNLCISMAPNVAP
jgi:hypothetical protein